MLLGNIDRLINTKMGIGFISIMLGLGLASLLRKVCKDKSCIDFNGPVITDISGNIFRYDDKCYTYEPKPVLCNKTKKIIDISSYKHEE
jgi:hypothetical protein